MQMHVVPDNVRYRDESHPVQVVAVVTQVMQGDEQAGQFCGPLS